MFTRKGNAACLQLQPDYDPDESRNQERAERILETALALILRWGYNKTTIADIARHSGVAKGTIYLHWKSRDELFAALIQREKLIVFQDIQERIQQDPQGWSLRSMVKHSALATIKRPLIKAILMGDRDVLGKLANREMGTTAYAERLAGFESYLELLRGQGLVRTDLSLKEQVYIWSAALTGFFFAAPLMPAEYVLSDEATADLMAEMVYKTLETGSPVSAEAYQAVSDAQTRYMQQTETNAGSSDAAHAGAEKDINREDAKNAKNF